MSDSIDDTNGVADSDRRKWAGICLTAACFLFLASGIAYFRRSAILSTEGQDPSARSQEEPQPTDESPVAVVGGAGTTQHQRIVELIRKWLLYSSLLLLAFMVAAFALSRWSRSYRVLLRRRSAKPTPTTDIWKMHELPPDQDDSPEDREDEA